jgi:hypothetical protein
MEDIEARMAEVFSSKMNKREASGIELTDVLAVIEQLGQSRRDRTR